MVVQVTDVALDDAASEFVEVAGMRITSLRHQIQRAKNGAVTKFFVPGILVEAGYTLLFAAPGQGKSLIAQNLACAASHGWNWMGLHQFPAGGIGVLYVDDDNNNEFEFNARCLAMGAEDNHRNFHCVLNQNFLFMDDEKRQALIDFCIQEGVKLAIFDSLVRLHECNEKQAEHMRKVNKAIKAFCLAGITVVILHHTLKGKKGADAFRGSGEIPAAADATIEMLKINSNTFAMIPHKVRSMGSGAPWDGCAVSAFTTPDGVLTLEAHGDAPAYQKTKSDMEREQAWRDKIEEALEDGPLTITELAKINMRLSSRDMPTFKTLLDKMVEQGFVTLGRVPGRKGVLVTLADVDEDDEAFEFLDEGEGEG